MNAYDTRLYDSCVLSASALSTISTTESAAVPVLAKSPTDGQRQEPVCFGKKDDEKKRRHV